MKDFIGETVKAIPHGKLSLELIVSNEQLKGFDIPHFYAIISNENGEYFQVLLHINTEYPFVDEETARDAASRGPIRGLRRHLSQILRCGSPCNDPYWNNALNYFMCVEQEIENINPRESMGIVSKLLLLCEVFKDRIIHVGNNAFDEEKHDKLIYYFDDVLFYYMPLSVKDRSPETRMLFNRIYSEEKTTA